MVDDHVLVREGLRRALTKESDFALVGEAASKREAFVQIPQEIRTEVAWSETVSLNYPTDLPAETPFRVTADTTFTIKGWLFPKDKDPAGNIFTIDTNFIPVSGFEIN